MGRKNRNKKSLPTVDTAVAQDDKTKNNDESGSDEENENNQNVAVAKKSEDPSSEDESSSDDEDDLALDGVLIRNPDASSSSEDEDDDDNDDNDEEEEEDNNKKPAAKDSNGKRSSDAVVNFDKKKKKKKKKSKNEPDVLNIEFTFCDFNDKFFHGLKSLLHNSSTVYQKHSSDLSDIMIKNIAVGTVVSTTEQFADDGTVFGFASVLNITTYQESPAIQYLKEDICLKHCPSDRKSEMKTVLSGKTNRPAGFLLHGRMLNVPLEIVNTLHEQLVLDMDWAVENAGGGVKERKSLDFGVFIRIAPCTQEKQGSIYYKYFDDEVLAGNADFTYNCPAPPGQTPKEGEKEMLCIIVLTKAGHRQAMVDLKQLVQGS